MALDKVYFVSQIVSAVTVVVSVLYLAAQIRANNKTLRSQGHYNALVLSQRPFEMLIEQEGLARIINIARTDTNELQGVLWRDGARAATISSGGKFFFPGISASLRRAAPWARALASNRTPIRST